MLNSDFEAQIAVHSPLIEGVCVYSMSMADGDGDVGDGDGDSDYTESR